MPLTLAGCLFPSGKADDVRAGGNFELTDRNRTRDDITSIHDLSTGATADPVKGTIEGVQLDVYGVQVPRGSVSANETFWKPVDEAGRLDQARHDLLFMNGFRVGVARADQWSYFRDILAKYPLKIRTKNLSVLEAQSFSEPVRKGIDSQVLSFFAPGQPVELKTYPDCDNWIAFSFVAAPQRDDACRVTLTPFVRSRKEKLEYSATNTEMPLRYVQTERLYDLNLSVELTFGEFLVVSPSTDVARQTSIGRNFMLVDDDAEQMETVLLIVAKKVEGKASKAAEPVRPGESIKKAE